MKVARLTATCHNERHRSVFRPQTRSPEGAAMSTRHDRPSGMPAYFLGRDLVTWRAALGPLRPDRWPRRLGLETTTST